MESGQETPKQMWKGKSKAIDQHFTDLNPTITYRHVLSQNLGVKDPLRVIALCDSDAFYAACEMVRLNVPPDTPLVVLQWDSLIAVNYPARKYGISRMDKKKDALKRCPHLKVVHVATYREGDAEPGYWDEVDTNTHKVSLDHYRRESVKVAAKFREMLPGCEVEKASIDEAFIDFTKPVKAILVERYPYLAAVPADAPLGVDSPLPPPPPVDWDGRGTVVPIYPSTEDDGSGEAETSSETAGPSAQVSSASEPTMEEIHEGEDDATTWHDVALSIAAELMSKAREEVLTKLGYSTSAKIRFLGGKLGKAMAEKYDVSTVGDLLTVTLNEMQNKFGEESIWVYEILRGIDRSEVKDKGTTLTKSMLAAKNLAKLITNASEGYHWIRVLAAELALRLNDARKASPNLWPKTIVVNARKGWESGRSKQAPFPFTKDVTVDVIASAGNKLWKELFGNSTDLKISTVSLSFTGIDVAETGQQTIEGFLRSKPPSKRTREDSCERPDASRAAEEAMEKSTVAPGAGSNEVNDQNTSRASSRTELSYTCPRCQKTLRTTVSPIPQEDDDDEREAILAALKLEHEDWHFAQDLAREEASGSIGGSTKRLVAGQQPQGSKSKKRRKEAVGIEKFFARK
ncbi:hypothetical protein H1R20_g14219, partial [Candolleomyces eurysporus]